jgi:hypothetical protein
LPFVEFDVVEFTEEVLGPSQHVGPAGKQVPLRSLNVTPDEVHMVVAIVTAEIIQGQTGNPDDTGELAIGKMVQVLFGLTDAAGAFGVPFARPKLRGTRMGTNGPRKDLQSLPELPLQSPGVQDFHVAGIWFHCNILAGTMGLCRLLEPRGIMTVMGSQLEHVYRGGKAPDNIFNHSPFVVTRHW